MGLFYNKTRKKEKCIIYGMGKFPDLFAVMNAKQIYHDWNGRQNPEHLQGRDSNG